MANCKVSDQVFAEHFRHCIRFKLLRSIEVDQVLAWYNEQGHPGNDARTTDNILHNSSGQRDRRPDAQR